MSAPLLLDLQSVQHGQSIRQSLLLHPYTALLLLQYVLSTIVMSCAGKGPIDNLVDHLANPAAINFTTNGVSLPGIPYMQP